MVRVEVEWALYGKRAGERDDYSVLAASRGLFQPAQFEGIITRFSPGNPDVPSALPRVTFSWVAPNDQPYLGMAIQETSGKKDGVGRAITRTRYFCLPYEQVARHPVTLLGLYEALQGLEPAEPGGAALHVDVPELVPQAVADDIAKYGDHTVRETAALLLTGRSVCVLQAEDVPLLDRLRFLDAVLGLLPYGFRTRLAASTWTNSASPHRIRLSFAKRARDSAAAVPWRTQKALVSPDEAVAYTYLKQLTGLLEGSRGHSGLGPVQLVRALAAEREPRKFDEPQEAKRTLLTIGGPFTELLKIREDAADPARVWELFGEDAPQIWDLGPAERREVLTYLIKKHQDRQEWGRIRRWWEKVVGETSSPLEEALVETAGHRLWARPTREVGHLLEHARDHGSVDRFLAGLLDFPRTQDALEAGTAAMSRLLRQEIIEGAGPDAFWATRDGIARNPSVFHRLIADLVAGGTTEEFTRLLDWLAPVMPQETAPFRSILELRRPTPAQLDTLEQGGYDRVRAALLMNRGFGRGQNLLTPAFERWLGPQGPPALRDLVLRAFRWWLDDTPSLGQEERGRWIALLGDARPHRPDQRASIDVLLIALGGRPVALPHVPTKDWPAYVEGFEAVWTASWTMESRARLMEGTLRYLSGPDWRNHSRDLLDVRRLVRQLADRTAEKIPGGDARLRDLLYDLDRPPVPRAALPQPSGPAEQKALTDWMAQGHGHPQAERRPSPENADDVLEYITQAHLNGHDREQVYALLAREKRLQSSAVALEVLWRLRGHLVEKTGIEGKEAVSWWVDLALEIEAERFGSPLAGHFRTHVMVAFPRHMLDMLYLMELVARRGDFDQPPDFAAKDRKELEELRRVIDGLLSEARRRGGRRRGNRSAGREEDARTEQRSEEPAG
ncbi:hypothetical protein DPM19_00040 [Actinomadura craniellae]|uniref:Uncharacterized protein n=1 Tax=Actinomadura craniellae TaxID=2231787 RepID=A0A365HBZ6_9ACTN|nr:hypothetical protein [Actinomadura craniellae]RAY16621.1 hypothetical protein DPM19_00040 [Actinomadura craniellae]